MLPAKFGGLFAAIWSICHITSEVHSTTDCAIKSEQEPARGDSVLKRATILILICLIFLPATVDAQKRKRRAPQRKPRVTKPSAEKASAELRAGRERVASQIKVLTQFLYLYGGITKGLESAELAARNGEASPAAISQNQQNKVKIKESIRNLRVGLDELENEFRSKPALKNRYSYLSGVALTGETAEAQAAAGRFNEAGRLLLKAVGQLADALAKMQ